MVLKKVSQNQKVIRKERCLDFWNRLITISIIRNVLLLVEYEPDTKHRRIEQHTSFTNMQKVNKDPIEDQKYSDLIFLVSRESSTKVCASRLIGHSTQLSKGSWKSSRKGHWCVKNKFLHHDNEPCKTVILINDFLVNKNTSVTP